MRSIKNVLFVLLVACAMLLSGCKGSPEDQLKDHTEAMASILDDNKESPADGIKEAREYLRDNLPAMMHATGEMIVELNQIEDDEERKERAKEFAESLKASSEAFQKAIEGFVPAAMQDEEAMKEIQAIQEEYGTLIQAAAPLMMMMR